MASMDEDSVDDDEFGACSCGPEGWQEDIMVALRCSEEDERLNIRETF